MDSHRRSDSAKPRYQLIAESLEEDIATGKYVVGGRLPSERELAKRMQASYLTVRQGVGELVKKGLVRREHGSGIHVLAQTAAPIIAIVFGPSLVDESAHFYRAMLKALQSEMAATPFVCRMYDGFNLAEAEASMVATPHLHLVKDTRNHPIKGVIAISLRDLKWLDIAPLRGVPQARFNEHDADVYLDRSVFVRSAMEFAVQNGRRKVVYICLRNQPSFRSELGELEATARRLAVPMPEVVLLEEVSPPVDVLAHEKVAQLALRWKEAGSVPDAIIVADDIATRGVAIALIKAGIDVPADMLLVNLANEGIVHHYGVNTVRYNISATEIAWKLLIVLEKRFRGQPANETFSIVGDWASNPTNAKTDRAQNARPTDKPCQGPLPAQSPAALP